MSPTIPSPAPRGQSIPAADLEPTAEQMTEARAHFAECADFTSARRVLSVATVHVEGLADALASGWTGAVATRVRAMRALRRAYEERQAELETARAGGAL